MATRLYKKKYILGVYDLEDNLVTVCDNVRDFANYFDKRVHDAASIVSRQFRGVRKAFLYHNRIFGTEHLKIVFIALQNEPG